MQELENENDKLKREVSKLMTSIASNTNFDTKGRKISPAGKEFLGNLHLSCLWFEPRHVISNNVAF